MSSYFVAARSVTRVATDFLDFKASELEKYAESQWNLLVENGVADRPDMVAAAKAGVESFAISIIRSNTELILGILPDGTIAFKTSAVRLSPDEIRLAKELPSHGQRDFFSIPLGKIDRVASGFSFGPFNWYVLITEERSAFYGDVEIITRSTFAILAASILCATILLLIFIRFLTKPLTVVAGAMRKIISSGDLSERVEVEYKDEIGQLSHTFNIMLGELEKAYNQIKRYAFDAVLAQKKAELAQEREAKIRRIFQKYVPQELIDSFFLNPESMLVGEARVVSILFSDIRSFTTISESMQADDLVSSLNSYFTPMVDIIMNRKGIIDKYIGDAIMAFFGAPVKHEDDVLQSVLAAFDMTEALVEFNAHQNKKGKLPFNIGIGINYGMVTVGNIGCERKMDYTVIGDNVNLASRLEGLTKYYRQPLIISESVYSRVKSSVPCRLLDTVAVKGKTRGVRIYTARRKLTEAEARAWPLHEEAMIQYYARRFEEASKGFRAVTNILGADDFASVSLCERCIEYAKAPPPTEWNGVEVMHEK